jgi:hypothetical protein
MKSPTMRLNTPRPPGPTVHEEDHRSLPGAVVVRHDAVDVDREADLRVGGDGVW